MLDTDSYIDTNNLVHAYKGQYSENGVLFAAYLSIFTRFNKAPQGVIQIAEDKSVWFDPNPDDNNGPDCHFSHDNMTAVYYWSDRNFIKHLPIIKWNGRYWFHPRDILFYLIVKGLGKRNFLIPLLIPFMIASLLKPASVASGKLLWALRCVILMEKCESELLSSIYEKMMSSKMEQVLTTYFTEKDHPIHTNRITKEEFHDYSTNR